MGNAAFAYAALEAGVNVVAGYPGTPSSEVIETIAHACATGAAPDTYVEWSTNEKAALELLAGASMAGARCLFTCKQVGLNVASDALMSLNYVGVKGGLVLFVADDPGPISSQTEQDTRRFASFAKLPVLDPATPEQGYAMMQYAFDLSERYGTPVIVRPTTRINHASTFFDIPDSFSARPLSSEGFVRDSKWIIFPRRSYIAHGEINDRLAAIACDDAQAQFNLVHEAGSATQEPKIGIVAGGVSSAYVLDALATMEQQAKANGQDVPAYRFMQVGTPYPFPREAARAFAEDLETIVVFEELDYVLEDEFLKLAGRYHLPFTVHGKLDETTLTRGENSVQACSDVLAEVLGVDEVRAADGDGARAQTGEASLTIAQSPEPPARPPVLCAGCPHRGSFYAVKKALGKRACVLCGDIGCYTLGNAQPLDAIDTCLCMGAGITMAQGFSVADPDKKSLAFIGDSTFFASGLTGVANAVYNQHDITIVVLDNSTTAMTGSQPHPGTGVTLMGGTSEPIDIETTLRALGVKCITRANAFVLEEATAAAAEAIDFEGPSAVIFTGPCIQLTKPQTPVVVDAQACTGCSACIASIGCPAMSMGARQAASSASDADAVPASAPAASATPASSTTKASKKLMYVNHSLCHGCNLCIAVCPFGAIKAGGANA